MVWGLQVRAIIESLRLWRANQVLHSHSRIFISLIAKAKWGSETCQSRHLSLLIIVEDENPSSSSSSSSSSLGTIQVEGPPQLSPSLFLSDSATCAAEGLGSLTASLLPAPDMAHIIRGHS